MDVGAVDADPDGEVARRFAGDGDVVQDDAVAVDGEPQPELTFSEGIAGKAWIPVAACNHVRSSVTITTQHPLDNQLSDGCVVQILDCAILDEGDLRRQADICSRRTGKANDIRKRGKAITTAEPQELSPEVEAGDEHHLVHGSNEKP